MPRDGSCESIEERLCELVLSCVCFGMVNLQ